MIYTDTKVGFTIEYPEDIYRPRSKENKGIILWNKDKDFDRDLYEISIIVLTKAQEKYKQDDSTKDILEIRKVVAGTTIQLVLLEGKNQDALDRFKKIVKSFRTLKK